MVIPSLLSDDKHLLQSQLDILATLRPRPTSVQIDIIDGEFADNLTIETSAIGELDTHDLLLDIHFMTIEPTQYLADAVGLPNVRTVIAQVEKLSDPTEFAQVAMTNRWQYGWAVDLYTPVAVLTEIAANLSAAEKASWQVVQIMGNQAGGQGEPLHSATTARIAAAVKLRASLAVPYRVVVDIGVNDQTWPDLVTAGMDDGVVGSFLWKQGSSKAAEQWQIIQERSGASAQKD